LSTKKLDVTCLILVLLIFVTCMFWLIMGGIKQKIQYRKENELWTKKLTELNMAEMKMSSLRVALVSTKRELKSLNESIPDSAEIGKFLKQLDSRMKAREITLLDIQPSHEVQEKLYTRIPLRLSMEGPFIRIYELLQDLETMARTLVMEEMVIRKSDPDRNCRAQLTASLFRRREEARE